MPKVEIIDAEKALILRSPTNQVLALGEALLLAEFTQMYGRMPAHIFSQRFMASAINNDVVMLYQTADNLPDTAIGFMLLGFLTPQIARLYEARNRDLSAAELTGGDELWVLDMATPFGHYTDMKRMLDEAYPAHANIWGLRDGKRTKFSNSVHKADVIPAKG